MPETAATIEQNNTTEVTGWDRLGIPALTVATAISNLGNGITNLAIPWFVLVTTGSPARTGIAGALVVLATVMSSVLGGPVVDRLGHKRASIFADLFSGVTVAIIPTLHFMDVLEFWHLLVLIFAGAIFDTPGSVARTALIPRLARQAKMPLERANSALQFADQSSRTLLGPLAAGALISLMGAASILYIDAATFAVSIVIVALLVRPGSHLNGQSTEIDEDDAPAQEESFFDSIRAGFRFTVGDEFLRLVLPISLVFNFVMSPLIAVILPVLARDEFDSASSLGLMIAGFGAGSAVGTLVYGWKGHQISRYWTFMIAVAAMAASFWMLPFATSVWLGTAATTLLGLAIGPTNVLGVTIMQSRIPEEMLGRVFGFVFALGGALSPLGVFLAGILIESVGLREVMMMAAGITTLAMLRVFSVQHIVRKFDLAAEPEQGTVSG